MKELLFKESGRKVYYNKIFSFDDDCDWVLEVGRTKSPEKVIGYEFEGLYRVDVKAFAGVYTGLEPGADGKVYVYELLKAHIEQVGKFSLIGNSVIPSRIDPIYKLSNVLYAIYQETDFKNINGIEVDLKRKYSANISATGEYAEYLKTHTVYEVNRDSLYNTLSASPDSSGMIRVVDSPKRNCIQLCHRSGKILNTEYNETLCYIFNTISSWELTDKGHLRVKLNKVPISTAEIICGYHMGYLSDALIGKVTSEIEVALVEMHKRFSAAGIEADHLSENPHNEYAYFLAAVSGGLNTSLGARRTGIIAPYYWYNIHDWARDKVLVECGVDGTSYKKSFSFSDLSNPLEAEAFKNCFNAFMAKVQEYGYYAGKGIKAKNNLLAHWTQVTEYRKNTPCTAKDPNNPMLALLQKPLAEFGRYAGEDFQDMPQMRTQSNY